MKTVKNQIDDLNCQVTLEISHEDYAGAEKKRLNEIRKKADFKGFRKGMAPMSLVQRAYGDQVLYEAVNEVISEGLNNFIKEENLHILGEPLASEDQPKVEWKSGNDFSFSFDIAKAPEIDFVPSKEADTVPYYEIVRSDEARAEMKDNMLRQLGQLQDAGAAGEDDFVIVDFSNDSKTVEDAYVAVRSVEGEAHSKFVGAKAGDKFDIDVNAAFVNESDRAAMLKVKKEELAGLNPAFQVSVVNVKTFVPAEESQETYDKLFGEDKVHNSEEFAKAIDERLEANYRQESDYRLGKDIRDYLVKKADIKLPEQFLKRWLFHINEGKFTMEQIEAEFDAFLVDYRWQIVRDHLMEKYGLKIEQADMEQAAEAFVSYQYAMYGMGNVPESMIKEAAKSVLKDERQARNIFENVQDQKVISAVRESVSFDTRSVSVEEFRALQ